jgi:hypothetical protein
MNALPYLSTPDLAQAATHINSTLLLQMLRSGDTGH